MSSQGKLREAKDMDAIQKAMIFGYRPCPWIFGNGECMGHKQDDGSIYYHGKEAV